MANWSVSGGICLLWVRFPHIFQLTHFTTVQTIIPKKFKHQFKKSFKMATTNALKSALMQKTELSKVSVKAEDDQFGSIDWSKHFFEPQPGSDYIIKFCKNIGGEEVTKRAVYKDLPDPTRRGKTFRYISSGNAKSCKVLQLFFDLNNEKKNGDAEAERKIKKYLGKSNQGACVVQIIKSPKAEEIGTFRIMTFATFGENATIANMINNRIKPSPAKIADGYEAEDIFDVFGSSALYLSCKEVSIGDGKGRGYSDSSWMEKRKYGCTVTVDGETHTFSEADKDANGELKPGVEKFFDKLIEELQNPDISIHNYFAYAEIGDPNNTKETEDYLKMVNDKVDEIVPVIREQSMSQIAAYGKEDTSSPKSDSAKTIGGKVAADILKESAPSEILGSTMNQDAEATKKPDTKSEPKKATPTKDGDVDNLVDNILGDQ